MRLLLIEDSTLNAQLYLRMLAAHGYPSVELVETGLGGLQAAQSSRFSAFIIDLDLPDIDGLQVGLALRHHMQQGRLPLAPLIALTARTDVATQHEAGQLGFDALICKPCGAADLIPTLRQQLPDGSSAVEST